MGMVYVIEGLRTYPTDQVTGEEVDWIVPRLIANANTVKFLYVQKLALVIITNMANQATYGEMDAKALD